MLATSGDPDAVNGAVDVLIVGGGPAGIFAALGLAAGTSLKRILLIDSGLQVNARRRLAAVNTVDLVRGMGGAGLFSDGKLCMSLDVGGDLDELLSPGEKRQLLRRVFRELGLGSESLASGRDSRKSVERRRTAARRVGLEFTHYPVVHVGTEHCTDLVNKLFQRAQARGVKLLDRTDLVSLRDGPDGFRATLRRGSREVHLSASTVVLAMGKVGADLQSRICGEFATASVSRPMYVGARVELSESDAEALFLDSLDPKYKLHFNDGTKVKTHCVAAGGEILALRYDGFPLAGGHSYRGRVSGRTSFGVLWDGVRPRTNAYGTALDLLSRSARVTRGALLVQRLIDHLSDRPSTAKDVQAAGPTTPDWFAGRLRDVLPDEYFSHMEPFLGALAGLGAHMGGETTLLYGPAVEWWMEKIPASRFLETRAPGLFVAGDGSGWSQGIVHAAATGLVAAEGVRERLREIDTRQLVRASGA